MKSILKLYGLLTLIVFSGCKELPGMKGQYLGSLTDSKGEQSVIVYANNLGVDQVKPTEVIISEINAAKQPLRIQFQFDKQGLLRISFNDVSQVYNFAKKDSCVLGDSNTTKVNLCFGKDQIRFEVENLGDSSQSFKVIAQKTDNMSVLKGKSSYSVEELVGRAKFINYTVEQKTQEVYRARKNVSVAIGHLLPSLNLKDVLGFASLDPGAVVDSIGNLLPFLFPSNWFELKQSKALYGAEVKSYAALRGNEMSVVEGLLYVHLRNAKVSEYLRMELTWLKEAYNYILARQGLNDMPTGSAEIFSLKLGALSWDKEQIDTFLEVEKANLAQAVALPDTEKLAIKSIQFPSLDTVSEISSDSCVEAALSQSLELETLDLLFEASKAQTEITKYSFLDPNSSDTIGFGTSSAIEITKSNSQEILMKKKDMRSLMQMRCKQAVTESNSAVRSYKIASKNFKNALNRKDFLMKEMRISGASLNQIEKLADNSTDVVKFASQSASASIQYLISDSKMKRLMLEGFYSDLEIGY